MGLQTSFGILSEILERHESRGGSVRDVEATTVDGEVLDVSMDVPVSLCAASGGLQSDVTPEAAAFTDEGALRIECSAAPASLPSAAEATVSMEQKGARVIDDEIVVTLQLTIEPDGTDTGTASTSIQCASESESSVSSPVESERTDGEATENRRRETDALPEEKDPFAAARDESVPPYEDTGYLRALYESCETFDEMSREIEMDVSAETVRRYMIDAEIHDPASYETTTPGTSSGPQATAEEPGDESDPEGAERDADGREAGGESNADGRSARTTPTADESGRSIPDEQLVTDGIGLPADLDVADVADAVAESITVYEVHRRLGIDRDRTRELLEQLDLLDLVLCRLGDDNRNVTYEQVATRIGRADGCN
jgi:hypothetical protein